MVRLKKLKTPFPKGWTSNIFLVPKKTPGEYRLILNLKKLNEYVTYNKFKMDHIDQVLNMVFPNCFFGSVDLTQAFNHLSMHKDSVPYLMFTWRGKYYCYTCAPNGLSNCPYMFTKISKPLLGYLLKQLVNIMIYIDDTLLVTDTKANLNHSIRLTLDAFTKAGFLINHAKSLLKPSQRIVFLGFLIDSVEYTISLTDDKRQEIFNLACRLLSNKRHKWSIKLLAKFIGKVVAAFPASEHALLHYRVLDHFKIKALRLHNDNWQAKVRLDKNCFDTLNWWKDNVFSDKMKHTLYTTPVEKHLYCDSSGPAWGSYLDGREAKDCFTEKQLPLSINTKELLAVLYGIMSHINKLKGKHVLVYSDNFTTVSTIKKRNSSDKLRDRIVGKIYSLVFNNNMKLSVLFIKGKNNYFADSASRSVIKNIHTEWSLGSDTVSLLKTKYGLQPDIDLFASHLNNIVPKFCSWYPCPGTFMVDCFNLDWSKFNCFMFPPFRLASTSLQKIEQDKAKNVKAIVPVWPSVSWWVRMVSMCGQSPILLPKNTAAKLVLPWDTSIRHPLSQQM